MKACTVTNNGLGIDQKKHRCLTVGNHNGRVTESDNQRHTAKGTHFLVNIVGCFPEKNISKCQISLLAYSAWAVNIFIHQAIDRSCWPSLHLPPPGYLPSTFAAILQQPLVDATWAHCFRSSVCNWWSPRMINNMKSICICMYLSLKNRQVKHSEAVECD